MVLEWLNEVELYIEIEYLLQREDKRKKGWDSKKIRKSANKKDGQKDNKIIEDDKISWLEEKKRKENKIIQCYKKG